ncbi:MAG: hypothetical protein OHK0046_51810 [Anaerolineae bacterium]
MGGSGGRGTPRLYNALAVVCRGTPLPYDVSAVVCRGAACCAHTHTHTHKRKYLTQRRKETEPHGISVGTPFWASTRRIITPKL